MADQKQVERLKQGVERWNRWRRKNREIRPDLSGADLIGANLIGADLSGTHLGIATLRGATLHRANLSRADLSGVDLRKATLRKADPTEANLRGADLREADLSGADLSGVDLSGAKLFRADLSGAKLFGAKLFRADLSGAKLFGADLREADLREADLSRAFLGATTIADVDLRSLKGLTTLDYVGPSLVELFSVQLPQDGSALQFLRGCGVPEEWIDYYRARVMYPIQYHSCFISYSSKDKMLAKRLHADLQAEGVRCWFAPEDMKIGDRIRQRIDEAIHLQDKLLLLLSEHSIASDWVADEVESAIEKEARQKRDVLFPIRLDASVMETTEAWAAKLRRSRHIGDFSQWESSAQAYQVAFERLLRDLKTGGR